MYGLIEILVRKNLEAEIARFRRRRLAQHDAMMATLLHSAQVDGARRLVGDLQAERVDIERAGPGEIGDGQLDMTEAHDVKGGIEVGLGQGHLISSVSRRVS